MKKIIYAVLVICLLVPVNSFAELTARQVIEKTWQGRRTMGQENTLWRVQDYGYKDGCDAFLNIERCYAPRGPEKHFAQSLKFDDLGKDGVWLHYFAPKKVKNKGVAIQLNPSDLNDSAFSYCRGRLDSKKGARQIVVSLSEHVAIDSDINGSWVMMFMQTGIELFDSDLFKYEFVKHNVFGFSNVFVVKVTSTGKLPGYTAVIDKNNFSIRGMNFGSYIVENISIDYIEGKWHPTEIFVWDTASKGTHLIQDNQTLKFTKWPKSYNKSSLPHGK